MSVAWEQNWNEANLTLQRNVTLNKGKINWHGDHTFSEPKNTSKWASQLSFAYILQVNFTVHWVVFVLCCCRAYTQEPISLFWKYYCIQIIKMFGFNFSTPWQYIRLKKMWWALHPTRSVMSLQRNPTLNKRSCPIQQIDSAWGTLCQNKHFPVFSKAASHKGILCALIQFPCREIGQIYGAIS